MLKHMKILLKRLKVDAADASSSIHRGFTESMKKIVAARQQWKCSECRELLESTYQIDHTIPLWKGGLDCFETNATALCPKCHAVKTQREGIERAHLHRLKREKQAQEAREEFFRTVEKEERAKQRVTKHSNGTWECEECGKKNYEMWPHQHCAVVEQRITDRINGVVPPKKTSPPKQIEKRENEKDPFIQFLFIKPIP